MSSQCIDVQVHACGDQNAIGTHARTDYWIEHRAKHIHFLAQESLSA